MKQIATEKKKGGEGEEAGCRKKVHFLSFSHYYKYEGEGCPQTWVPSWAAPCDGGGAVTRASRAEQRLTELN
jgi:hypothetical protein